MKRMSLIALAAATLVCAGLSLADSGGRGAGGPIARHAERLGLDESTLNEIERLARESRESGEEVRQELRAARKQLFELLEAESPDEGAVMAQADRIGALETQKRKHRLTTSLKIRSLLTPDQRTELSKIMGERREARERRRAERMAAVQTACAEDLTQFCADVPEGKKRGRCLFEHREQLSDSCRGVMRPERGHGHRGGPGK